MRIDSSAPTRIDLAGGTYDIWPLYLLHDGAQTINAAISLRAHCAITTRPDFRVTITSEDSRETIEAAGPDTLPVDRLGLPARLVKHFGARGIDVRIRSLSPIGAGIGGSSAVAVAVAAALASWTGRPLEDETLLLLAMNVEAQVLGVPAGVQDFRPAFYGGISAVEMTPAGVQRIELAASPDALGERLVLAYTGASRNSGVNNWDVMVRRINADPVVIAAFDGIRDAAADMRRALDRGDWTAVAAHLRQEWEHRKRLAPGVTTPAIEDMLGRASAAGALAGKVCGAGGGGCLMCLAEPSRRDEVARALESAGATVLPVTVERDGLRLERG